MSMFVVMAHAVFGRVRQGKTLPGNEHASDSVDELVAMVARQCRAADPRPVWHPATPGAAVVRGRCWPAPRRAAHPPCTGR